MMRRIYTAYAIAAVVVFWKKIDPSALAIVCAILAVAYSPSRGAAK